MSCIVTSWRAWILVVPVLINFRPDLHCEEVLGAMALPQQANKSEREKSYRKYDAVSHRCWYSKWVFILKLHAITMLYHVNTSLRGNLPMARSISTMVTFPERTAWTYRIGIRRVLYCPPAGLVSPRIFAADRLRLPVQFTNHSHSTLTNPAKPIYQGSNVLSAVNDPRSN
jgi:hypothetical protein